MKRTLFTAVAAFAAAALAQVTHNEDGSYTCPSTGGTFCAGRSGYTNIIIRCEGTVGHATKCDDNLAGAPPIGVSYSPCVQTSSLSGDAACSKHGIVYPDPESVTRKPLARSIPSGTGSGQPTSTVTPPYPITYPHGWNTSTTVTVPPPPTTTSISTSPHTTLVVPPPPQPSVTTHTQFYTVTVTESLCSSPTGGPGPVPQPGSSSTVTITDSTSTYTTTYTTSSTTITTSKPTWHTTIIYPSGGMSGYGVYPKPTVSPPAYQNAPADYRHRAVRRSVPEVHPPIAYQGAAASISINAASFSTVAAVLVVSVLMTFA